MLAVAIAAGGRAKNAPEQGLALSYLDKARDHGRALGFHGFRLTEADSRTGERLAAAIKGAAFGVALDERGQSLDSVQFARWLAD
jgi:23S rRNA pseudoU1915 N3-methylase RlmH